MEASQGLIPGLQGKKRQILHALVELYLETGEAVGSAAVARGEFIGGAPSPATVRNAMAEMAEMGLLTQPHASAGRVPTPMAIRDYVAGLRQVRTNAAEVSRLHRRLKEIPAWADRVEESSHELTGRTRNLALVAAVPEASPVLRQVELLPLGARQYLMVVVTADENVRNQVVRTGQELSSSELGEIRNYINREFAGWTLDEARTALEQRLADERSQYHALLRKVEVFHAQGLFVGGDGPRIFLDGAAYLVGLDLHLTRERMRELFEALAQKQQLLQMLDQFLQGAQERPAIQVGLGEIHPALSEFSLIGVEAPIGGGLTARVAVLGPLRLNYPRTIAAVMEVGLALTDSASWPQA
jgi:heat-inducible transcriptional repressor